MELRPLFLKLRLTKITFFDMKNTWYLVGMYIWAFWGYCSTVFFLCVCVAGARSGFCFNMVSSAHSHLFLKCGYPKYEAVCCLLCVT